MIILRRNLPAKFLIGIVDDQVAVVLEHRRPELAKAAETDDSDRLCGEAGHCRLILRASGPTTDPTA